LFIYASDASWLSRDISVTEELRYGWMAGVRYPTEERIFLFALT